MFPYNNYNTKKFTLEIVHDFSNLINMGIIYDNESVLKISI